MKTIVAAAVASLMLSGAAFAAAPAIVKEAPKAQTKQEATIKLAAGQQRSHNQIGRSTPFGRVICLPCGI